MFHFFINPLFKKVEQNGLTGRASPYRRAVGACPLGTPVENKKV